MNYLRAIFSVSSAVLIWKDTVEKIVGNSRLPNLSYCHLYPGSLFSIRYLIRYCRTENLGHIESSWSGFDLFHMTYLTSTSGNPLSFHVWTWIIDFRAFYLPLQDHSIAFSYIDDCQFLIRCRTLNAPCRFVYDFLHISSALLTGRIRSFATVGQRESANTEWRNLLPLTKSRQESADTVWRIMTCAAFARANLICTCLHVFDFSLTHSKIWAYLNHFKFLQWHERELEVKIGRKKCRELCKVLTKLSNHTVHWLFYKKRSEGTRMTWARGRCSGSHHPCQNHAKVMIRSFPLQFLYS